MYIEFDKLPTVGTMSVDNFESSFQERDRNWNWRIKHEELDFISTYYMTINLQQLQGQVTDSETLRLV